jgi:pSer/pThr/pTyr-binding forkhead associated (FHA) protein
MGVRKNRIMKALLVALEGPEAGHTYPLDPNRQSLLSMGRSSGCDLVVRDHRASRHHCDIRWNGFQWEVLDRGSTNGTRVNGEPIHQPVALAPGSTIGIGDTTLVLRQHAEEPTAQHPPQASTVPSQPALSGQPGPLQPVPIYAAPVGAGEASAGVEQRTSAGVQVAFWLVQVLIGAAVACLAAGAFLPWFRVTGSLSSELESLIRGISDIVSSFIGEGLLSVTQDISALSGFGRLTLGLAVLSGIMLIVDIFLRRKSAIAGLVYLFPTAVVSAVIVGDLKNLYDLYEQVQSISLLFGIQLADVVEAFGKFIDVEVALLPGLYLTVIGLGLLIVGGIARLIVALLARGD